MKRKKLLSGILALSCAITLLPAAPVSAAEPQTGTFTAVSMNVDGLPTDLLGFININEGGPGPDGTRAIGQKMAEYGWDIIGVSEDFNYNDELMEALSEDYNAGTHRGGVSWLTNDTDGLNLLWKKSLSVTGESWTKWNTQYSTGFANTGNGADGMINKGFRYYEAEVADGVYVDFYILHMDADSDQGDIDARHAQLIQLADALMAVDKGGTYQYPQAEIVDKIFYINNTDSQVKLTLDSYDVATDFTNSSGAALADHWPIIGTFTYTVEQEEGEHVHSYVMTEESPATCTEEGYTIYTCACGESYEEPLAALGHDYQISSRTEATCTEPGEIVYTCGRCGDSYLEMIPAAGHNYQDGVCANCGAQEPSAGSENVFGETAGEIASGSRYALVTSSSTQNFALTCEEDGTVSWAETETAPGTGAADGMAWTVEKSGSGYTISTEINGMKKYLARTNSFVGYGYKVALQDSPFVWSMQYKSATDGFRVSTKILFKNYALRYYNSKTGWIVTTKGMDIQLYNLTEQTGQ